MVHARIDNFQLDPVPIQGRFGCCSGMQRRGGGGLMEAESWVTSKVHQRIDSLWRPWHTVRVMDRCFVRTEAHRPAPQNSPNKNKRLGFTFKVLHTDNYMHLLKEQRSDANSFSLL